MSESKTGVAETLAKAIEDWSAELFRSIKQRDEHGREATIVPVLQMFMDIELTQLKIEALFEELGRAGFVDSPRVMDRLLRKLEHARKELKQATDARPKLALAAAVAGAINGKVPG